MRLGLVILFSSPALLLGEIAHAERGEWSAGISSGLVLPALQAQDATSFRVAAFGASIQGRYGLLDDLALGLTGSWAQFAGQADEVRSLGTEVLGVRVFEAQQFQVGATARYKVLSGYFVAPYVEAGAGFMWVILRNQDFRSIETGQSFGLDVQPEGFGRATATFGVSVDARILNWVFVGAAVRWTEVIGGRLYRRFVSIPVELSVYW